MSKEIVNLTCEVVSKKLDRVLETYPYSLYQEVVEKSDLRLELIAYVLNRVSNLHVVTQQEKNSPVDLRLASKELVKIDALIVEGIHVILPKVMESPPQECCEILQYEKKKEEAETKVQEGDWNGSVKSCRWDELATYTQLKWAQI
ncbi:late competence development ComFB family protein [Phormidium sp. CCY1219]|uniref:late competence development ComFB family protein n=1 Tax=Phormidium sp. CCY1219 TaxID=2886104 RepID=UPI002D1F1618|nr:hypothetical protein [Phormidium sp. CCY1219]MEB3830620.1 hypothetical protein [Phormidium sp. CCY1219]